MLDNLNFFGLIEKFNSLKENFGDETSNDQIVFNNENNDIKQFNDENNNDGKAVGKAVGQAATVFFIFFIVIIVLTIWCIVALATFNLPSDILILCIVLLIFTGPVIPLILAYVFKGKGP